MPENAWIHTSGAYGRSTAVVRDYNYNMMGSVEGKIGRTLWQPEIDGAGRTEIKNVQKLNSTLSLANHRN
jgi:hypothetical protein